MAIRKRRAFLSLSAAVVLAVGACGGDDDDEAPPLDPAAVKAAIEEEIEVTQFCELGQLALASGEAVTCPAVTTTEKGLVEGDLVLTREGDEEELAYEISMSGPGGNKFGGGTINVTEEGPSTDDDEAVAGGSPLERELSGSLDGAEVSCSPAKPPAKGETVICTASGEDEDGEGFEGEVIVKPSPGAGAIGAEYSYEARLEKEGGGTRFTGGVFSLD
jgi:hypothetical protein